MSYETILEKVFTVAISGSLGWLISAATKVSNSKLEKAIGDLERRVILPIVTRVERLESKADSFATRSDVKEIVLDLKTAMNASHQEIRSTIKGLFRELRGMRDRRSESVGEVS